MENPLEKYRYKFKKDSGKPASIEEIEAFESEHSLILPPELKLYYQLYNGAYLAYRELPNVYIKWEKNPDGLERPVHIDYLYEINNSFYPQIHPGYYPGCPSVVDYNLLLLDSLPFDQWSKENQENYSWYEDWYPEKPSEYLSIGHSEGTGELLIGMTAKNFGQLFHWDPDTREKYNPNYIAASISEMLERLVEW